MIRIVTAATYAALLADRDDLRRTRAALANADRATTEAKATADDFKNTAAWLRKDAEAAADARDRALTDLARVRKEAQEADRIAGEGTQAIVRQVTRERDTAREEAGALDDVRQDVLRLRDFAADPDNGHAVRGAIAYGVLRDLITRARQERAEAGEEGGLPRPFDVVALVLGFDNDGQDDGDAAAPVREDTAADCRNGTCSCHDRDRDRDKEADPGTRVCAACSARRPHADFDHGPICRNCPRMSASYHAARNA
ncbi:hypothetical protein [Streptomyces erythrochromogenes]|uniref:hypothetical protein n=1 Tax=Streptomyces erythrochromogenes TaxID=285574 RepID=UPI003863D50A|nr:hypothetical protein OG364_29625 [Streptomyces erythrochromogenes]